MKNNASEQAIREVIEFIQGNIDKNFGFENKHKSTAYEEGYFSAGDGYDELESERLGLDLH